MNDNNAAAKIDLLLEQRLLVYVVMERPDALKPPVPFTGSRPHHDCLRARTVRRFAATPFARAHEKPSDLAADGPLRGHRLQRIRQSTRRRALCVQSLENTRPPQCSRTRSVSRLHNRRKLFGAINVADVPLHSHLTTFAASAY